MAKVQRRNFRKGITIKELLKVFSDNALAEAWFIEQRWPDGIACPKCGSTNILIGAKHKSMPFRCRNYKNCGKRFSVKTGTVMESAKIEYQDWLIATYMLTTNSNSVSSMNLHLELGITQKSAWFLAHRLRKALEVYETQRDGSDEVDESNFGNKERTKHRSKKLNTGRGTVEKTAVVGARSRKTNDVAAKVVESTDKETRQSFVRNQTSTGSTIYTDSASACSTLGSEYDHETDNLLVGEFNPKMAQTISIESISMTLKRAHNSLFYKITPKYFQRYVNEFSRRHSIRSQNTFNNLEAFNQLLKGKRLGYKNLIADNGLDSGVRL